MLSFMTVFFFLNWAFFFKSEDENCAQTWTSALGVGVGVSPAEAILFRSEE
jgi:hypothetical protein